MIEYSRTTFRKPFLFLLVASPSFIFGSKPLFLILCLLIATILFIILLKYAYFEASQKNLLITPYAVVAFFCIAYWLIHPIIDIDGLTLGNFTFGASDSDNAIDLFIEEFSSGRYPYSAKTFLNNPITPMPGTIILSLPFYILGHSGLQNIFWLCVLLFFMSKKMKNQAGASIASLAFLLMSPVILYQVVQATDYLANSIYVLIALVSVYESLTAPHVSYSRMLFACVFLGVALTSRLNFLLILPLLTLQLFFQTNILRVCGGLFITLLTSLSLVYPFLGKDSLFSPLHTHSKITADSSSNCTYGIGGIGSDCIPCQNIPFKGRESFVSSSGCFFCAARSHNVWSDCRFLSERTY